MKGLLILLAIYLLEIIFQKIRQRSQRKAEEAQRQETPPPLQDSDGESGSNRNLQDLIRQFEHSQQQAAQGNIEPPISPRMDERVDEEIELNVVEPATPGHYTFMEIAQSVIQWEFVSVDLLQQAFSFSESTAIQVLKDLQEKKICGSSVGDDECDLLVHSKDELDNLLKRLQRDAEEKQAQKELQKRKDAELEHQKALAELEERARQIREQNGQFSGLPDEEQETTAPCLATSEHAVHRKTFNRSEIRRGFIWAKVLDEPRFKKRWNSRVR